MEESLYIFLSFTSVCRLADDEGKYNFINSHKKLMQYARCHFSVLIKSSEIISTFLKRLPPLQESSKLGMFPEFVCAIFIHVHILHCFLHFYILLTSGVGFKLAISKMSQCPNPSDHLLYNSSRKKGLMQIKTLYL